MTATVSIARLTDIINEALKQTADGQRHVHAARNGCPGCAREAAQAVARIAKGDALKITERVR